MQLVATVPAVPSPARFRAGSWEGAGETNARRPHVVELRVRHRKVVLSRPRNERQPTLWLKAARKEQGFFRRAINLMNEIMPDCKRLEAREEVLDV